jgi:hypothetical protein
MVNVDMPLMDERPPLDSMGLPVLIQKPGERLYLRGPNDWVRDRRVAKVFHDTASAIEYCNTFAITEYEIALQVVS